MSTPTRKLKLIGGTLSGLLQFSGTTHAGIQLNSLTTTQRDALTPANGMLIYNSTTGTVQRYAGGAWVTVTASQLYAENPSSPGTPVASGTNAVAIGNGVTASGANAFATGIAGTASGYAASVSGNSAIADLDGQHAIGHGLTDVGYSQISRIPFAVATNDATPTELAGANSGRLAMRANTLWQFSIQVAARRVSGLGHAAWKVEGAIYRDATAGSTTMLGDLEVSPNSANVAGWDFTASADTTNGALKLTATGGAYSVRWTAAVHLAEITTL